MFFSIIIPTYNRAHLLATAIESVLNQSFKDFELLIVDDGSTDKTKELVGSYKDDRIVYIYQRNAERSAARNNGIVSSKGKYICFLDSDDYYLINRLDLLHRFLTTHKLESEFFVTDLQIDNSNKLVEHKIRLPKNHKEIEQVLFQNIFCQQICVSRNVLEKHQFNVALNIGEDTELWLRIFKETLPTYVPNQATVVVVEHEERSINWKEKNFSKKLLKMLNLVFSSEHSGKLISKQTQKQCFAITYFGIAKFHIWNGQKGKAFKNLLKSIFVDLLNNQNKYKLNILLNLIFNLSKSKKLIDINS